MACVTKPEKGPGELTRAPDEAIYRMCYAPVDVRSLLQDPLERGKIRRLPASQVYFALKELDDEEIRALLPYVTEEQWQTILDLDLWDRDRLSVGSFLRWQRFLLGTDDAVARKLLRATERELWELSLIRELEIYARTEEDEFSGEPQDRPAMMTPDRAFLIGLPRNAEKERLYRSLLERLYELAPEETVNRLAEAVFRTPSELEEEAYQNRRRRIEMLGFQDYFEAISVYTPLTLTSRLPEKRWELGEPDAVLPSALRQIPRGGPMLLFRALASVSDTDVLQRLVEELFHVCNKVLIADRTASEDPARVKRSLRKAVTGISLGLSVWSDDRLERAESGLRRHFLVSFFQVGYGQLQEVRRQAQELAGRGFVEPGSYLEAALEGFLLRFPLLTEQGEKSFRRRFFQDQADLKWAYRLLEEIRATKRG
jgi:hypothetical protein